MPTRANIENTQVPLQRESEIFIAGYPIPLVTEYTGDVTVQDDTYDVFGVEEQLYFRTIDSGSMTMRAGYARENQIFMDLISDTKPDATAFHTYYPNTKVQLDVVRMYRTPDDDGYYAVEFAGRWTPVVRVPAGGPRERGVITAEGKCEVPVRIVADSNKWISAMFDVVALVAGTAGVVPDVNTGYEVKESRLATGTSLLSIPVPTGAGATGIIKQIPVNMHGYRNAGKYAFSVEVQHRGTSGVTDGVVTKYARVPVTTGMIDPSTGNVTITDRDLQGTSLSIAEASHVFVTYLVEYGGVAPGLMGQAGQTVSAWNARFD